MNPERCLVCHTSPPDPRWESLLRCPRCGFVTARLDAPIDVRQLYADDYFHGAEYLDYLADEACFRRNFRRRLQEVRGRCPHGRLVEIGAAYGFFLHEAHPYYETIGFELNPEAVRHASEKLDLDVRTDDFLQATPASIGGPIDVLVLWDVIEHLERPDAILAHARSLMNPGGWLWLTTGDIGSLLARLRGPKWRMIHPPTHLHYFDRDTMTRLLDACGFAVEGITTVGVTRSLRQIAYSVLALGMKSPRAYRLVKRLIPSWAGLTLNTYDIMMVAARVRDEEGGRKKAIGDD